MTADAQEREEARQAAWRAYRPTLAKRHADFKRKCDDEGTGHLALPPLPTTAPPWFKVDTGVPEIIEGEDRAPDPTRIDLPAGVDWMGRPVAAPVGPAPEAVFAAAAKPSIADRLRGKR